MEELVNEILDKLESAGYECTATYVEKECCGGMYMIDYNYFIDSDSYFRILVKPEGIEISKLMFDKIMISFAAFNSADKLISTIDHCKEIDNQ